MQPDRFGTTVASQSREIDQGLRDHMNSIYARMALGVVVTALVSFGLSQSPQLLQLIFGTPLKYVAIFAPMAIIMFGFNPARMSANTLRLSFLAISVCYGISFGTIFAMFSSESIANAFFVSAGAFAGLSIFGYTTKKNLDGVGSFLIMGMIGVLILGIANMFIQSSMLMNIVSVVTLIVFAGMTAWETQRMKEMYNPANGSEANSRIGWIGALNLYVSFIAIFQSILHLLGSRQ